MQSLEDELNAIKYLKIDLTATITSKEEVPSRHPDIYLEEVPTSLRLITYPDTQKRENATKSLENIYNSSDWYSARYSAAKALDKDYCTCEKMNQWFNNLKDQLKITKKEFRYKGKELWDSRGLSRVNAKETTVNVLKDLGKLAKISKCPALKDFLIKEYTKPWDSESEYEEAGSIYKTWNSEYKEFIRIEFGKALGHSNFSIKTYIWFLKHGIN
jgi:hypothetical protein